jgi:hypothetical protein
LKTHVLVRDVKRHFTPVASFLLPFKRMSTLS